VGAAALGIPPWIAAAVLAAAVVAALVRAGAPELPPMLALRPAVAIVLAVTFVAASAYTTRLSRFMLDETRADLSVLPSRPFFRTHSCLSSYTEAARIAPGGANVFDPAQYVGMPAPGRFKPRFLGPFEIDLYQYPPPFLLLPRAALSSGLDFLSIRRAWFAVQAVLLFGAMYVLATWVGGARGGFLLLLMPIVWLAPTTRLTLQIGNFQLTALALAMLAMVAFERRRHARGALALGFSAVSKIFPGVLGLLLLAQRRWKEVAWTAAGCVVLTLAALLLVGMTPFRDFVHYQLPRIESGEAFFWIEDPVMAPVNHSVYGLVTKLRLLGLPGTGKAAANIASSAYALLLVPLAVVAGIRLRGLRAAATDASLVRLRHAQVWLGLVSLASFRSPFVPDAYGFVGTVWLLLLIAAEGRPRPGGWTALGVAAIAFTLVLDGGLVPAPVPVWMSAGTLVIQIAALMLNAAVVVTPGRTTTAFVDADERRTPLVPATLAHST
jgi:alpha-1,2-mannosyltransferase